MGAIWFAKSPRGGIRSGKGMFFDTPPETEHVGKLLHLRIGARKPIGIGAPNYL
jgi:hypothetical protein